MHRRLLDDCGKQLCQTRFAAGSLQVMDIKESASKWCLLLFSPDSPSVDASCIGKRKRQPGIVVGSEAGHGFAWGTLLLQTVSGQGKAGEEHSPQLCGVPWLCLIWAKRLWQRTKLTQKHCNTCSTETTVLMLSAFAFTSVRSRHWGGHIGWESFGICTHTTGTVCPRFNDQLTRAHQKLEASQIFNKRYGMFSAFRIYILKKKEPTSEKEKLWEDVNACCRSNIATKFWGCSKDHFSISQKRYSFLSEMLKEVLMTGINNRCWEQLLLINDLSFFK